MLRRLVRFVKSAGASSESESDRDGAFSWHGETHSFVNGYYTGFTSRPLRAPETPDEEPVYFRAGYVCGTVSQVGVLVVAAWLGLPRLL